MIKNKNNIGRRIRIRKEKSRFKACTIISWEEVNKLIELINYDSEVYHIGEVVLFKND
jgi:hypothetical protein